MFFSDLFDWFMNNASFIEQLLSIFVSLGVIFGAVFGFIKGLQNKHRAKKRELSDDESNNSLVTDKTKKITSNDLSIIVEKIRQSIREADQDIHWNISLDIYEKAAFFVDQVGNLYFKDTYTGHSVFQISDVTSHIDGTFEDVSVKFVFDNGDSIMFGCSNNCNSVCLESHSSGSLLSVLGEDSVLEYLRNNFDQSNNPQQIFSSCNDVISAWNHCCFCSHFERIRNQLSISEDGNIVISVNDEELICSVNDVLAIKYISYTSSVDSDMYGRSVDIILRDQVIYFEYEYPYMEDFRMGRYSS